jgi:hypothetical protein
MNSSILNYRLFDYSIIQLFDYFIDKLRFNSFFNFFSLLAFLWFFLFFLFFFFFFFFLKVLKKELATLQFKSEVIGLRMNESLIMAILERKTVLFDFDSLQVI